MNGAVRERLLLQVGQRTQLSSVVSGKTLWRVRDVLRGLGSLGDAVLVGSWARYLVTSNKLILRRDVDLMISERLSKRFYELALALRREGFHPIIRIPDPELDEVLNSAGLSQEPVRTEQGSNRHWGLFPRIGNDRIRNYLGLDLDLIFTPGSFEVIPGHWAWVDNGDHDRLIRNVRNSAGTEFVFDNAKKVKMGLLVASLDAQLQSLRLLLERRSSKNLARAIAQLEKAREQRRLS
jgi:hypothetical protein